jgi:hypothetical protein
LDGGIIYGRYKMIKWHKYMMELSKEYMGYGENTPKIKFWFMVPKAFSKLYYYTFRDWILRKWYKWNA